MKQREWPNNAKEARDKSAERAMRAYEDLKPLIDNPHAEDIEVVQRAAKASTQVLEIARLMVSMGSKAVDPLKSDAGLELSYA